jgi:hypothetical protein
MSRDLLAQLPRNPNHKYRIQGLAFQRTSSPVPGLDAGLPLDATASHSSLSTTALGFGLTCAGLRDSTFVLRVSSLLSSLPQSEDHKQSISEARK